MKRIKTLLLFIATVMILSQVSAQALTAASEAQVEFTAGQGPTYPVNPEDPSVDGGGEGVTGSLAIVSVSDFDFGTIAVASEAQLLDSVTVMPNIQIVDLRGTGAGWNVKASVTRFTNTSGTNTLPGAVIYITDGRPNSLSVSPVPVQNKSAALTSDGASALILHAEVDAGLGLWVMRWYADPNTPDPPEPEPPIQRAYVKLAIPAAAASLGTHTATLNWVLENAP